MFGKFIFSFLYPVTIEISSIPYFLKISIILSNRVFFPNSIRDLGLSLVNGDSLLPKPAAKIMALVIIKFHQGHHPNINNL